MTTLRPWELDPDPGVQGDIWLAAPSERGSYEGKPGRWVAKLRDRDDGVLIVRAVNAFDALLAVAKASDDALIAAMALDERLDSVLHIALNRLDREHPGWRKWAL